MPVTDTRLRELLSSEEIDYSAAAAEVGTEGLDLLDTMVQDPDAGLAARAASVAGFIGRDSASALAAVPVLITAIGHADEGVRGAAAHSASGVGLPGVPVVLLALADTSFSV